MIIGLDTALQNSGLVILDGTGAVLFSGKPFPIKLSEKYERLRQVERIATVVEWTNAQITRFGGVSAVELFAMEDYLLTGYQKGYEVAELTGILKHNFWCAKVPYCLVHPGKTKKYVVKKRDVSKTDMIAFAKQHQPEVFKDIERADFGDVADAWAIAKIGQLVAASVSAGYYFPNKPYVEVQAWVRSQAWEPRWQELLAVDESGILTKFGLCVVQKESV